MKRLALEYIGAETQLEVRANLDVYGRVAHLLNARVARCVTMLGWLRAATARASPGLRVASRSSSFRFRGNTRPPREIGLDLGVGSMVEGAVRREGERIFVRVELTGAADGLCLWSGRFEGDRNDLFAIQESIALPVSAPGRAGLRGRCGADARAARRRGVAVAEAHLAYHPDDVRALYMAANGLAALRERERGLAWAQRAADLEPNDSMTLYNVACVRSLAGQVGEALEALERAIEAGLVHREWIESDSNLDALRRHPRFAVLLERVGQPGPVSGWALTAPRPRRKVTASG